jgi:hypothetical protein
MVLLWMYLRSCSGCVAAVDGSISQEGRDADVDGFVPSRDVVLLWMDLYPCRGCVAVDGLYPCRRCGAAVDGSVSL